MRIPRILNQFMIRAGAMFIVKLIGLAGRVILTRIVGAEGIGLYQIAYSFYGFILMLTSGFQTTLAIATAKAPMQGWRILKMVLLCLVLSGGVLSLCIFKNSTAIGKLLGNSGLEYAIRSLALSLFIVPLLGLVRGYLQGMKQVGIIALSEIAEQAFRTVFMLLIVGHLFSLGVERAVGYGLYSTFFGAFLSFIILTLFISLKKADISFYRTPDQLLTTSWFVNTSLAISATRLLIPFSEFLDALIIPSRLVAAGNSASEATAIYGVIYGMAVIVVYAPTLFIGALSHILTSHIVAEWQQGNQRKFISLCNTAICTCWLWGGLTSLFLFVYADELSIYIFDVGSASQVIRYLAPIPLIVGFREISTSILWAQEIRKNPFLGILSGIACSIIVQYILVAIPGFGYKGAAIAILLLEVVASVWNIKVLRLKKVNLKMMVKPLLCDITFGICILLVMAISSHSVNILGLWQFLYISVLFLMVTGVYIYLRCIRKLL
ncbi:oligosaccharide flippase family protein [Paenibacillus pseudetheri]|uniref:Stage V sporulation protein B n=1 Tax=Paenibacillus pseudetheri TaxID=2897682 RepID=A0ABM9BJY0_9BACL|nr:oligosaccharide flippase family protein [Paenibacillus pseudetheri]CAH1059447.1 Stage V sporulation protein B [Paenibacillus pseudetheri]